MNRRSSIKNIALLGLLGVSSFSMFKWFGNKDTIPIQALDDCKPLIAELAETIIPRTDTPGAKDAKVEEFIVLMIKEGVNQNDQSRFLRGLFDLREYSLNHYQDEFQNCSLADKIAVLNHFESLNKSSNSVIRKVKEKIMGTAFLKQLKELTIEGFCTSQIGATQALAYDYLPGIYQPCVKLQPGQKSWVTK